MGREVGGGDTRIRGEEKAMMEQLVGSARARTVGRRMGRSGAAGEEEVGDDHGKEKKRKEKKRKKRKKERKRGKKIQRKGWKGGLAKRKKKGRAAAKRQEVGKENCQGISRVWRLGGLGPKLGYSLSTENILFFFCKLI